MRFPKSLSLHEPAMTSRAKRRRYSVVTSRLRVLLGEVDFTLRKIKIRPGGDRVMLTTLIHEAIHVANPDLSEDGVLRAEWNVVAVLDECLKEDRWPLSRQRHT